MPTAMGAIQADISLAEARRLRYVGVPETQAAVEALRRRAALAGDPELALLADELECRLQIDSKPALALSIAEAGLARASASTETPALLRLRGCHGLALIQTGAPEAGMQALDQLISTANAYGAPEAAAIAQLDRGSYRSRSSDSISGQEDLLAACARIESLGMEDMRIECGESIAVHYGNVGDLQQALRYHQETLDLAVGLGAKRVVPIILYNMADVFRRNEDLTAALNAYTRAKTLEAANGDPLGVAYNDAGIGYVMNRQGHAQPSLPHFEHAIDAMKALGDGEWSSVALDYARALIDAGQLEQALQTTEALATVIESADNDEKRARWHELLADEYAQLEAWQPAYEHLAAYGRVQAWLVETRGNEQAARLRLSFDRERAQQQLESLQFTNAQQLRLQSLQFRALTIVLGLLALSLALMILLMRQKRRMRELALTDELTGLPNRRAILGEAREVLSRNGRSASSAMMLDLDHFKAVNDQYGHDVGDRVLCEATRVLKQHLPSGGRLGRMGGEEFLVLLPDCTGQQAILLAGELCRWVRETARVTADGREIRITLSVGVSSAKGHGDLEQLLRDADSALYQAKNSGRDRAVALPH